MSAGLAAVSKTAGSRVRLEFDSLAFLHIWAVTV